MFSTPDDIVTGIGDCSICLNDEGNLECNSDESCSLCYGCLSDEMINELHVAYREHQRRQNFLRIFPHVDLNPELFKEMTNKSQLMTRWYRNKCDSDPDWC
jgi:hypothetical protein